jgi:hypothetical protein
MTPRRVDSDRIERAFEERARGYPNELLLERIMTVIRATRQRRHRVQMEHRPVVVPPTDVQMLVLLTVSVAVFVGMLLQLDWSQVGGVLDAVPLELGDGVTARFPDVGHG